MLNKAGSAWLHSIGGLYMYINSNCIWFNDTLKYWLHKLLTTYLYYVVGKSSSILHAVQCLLYNKAALLEGS